MYWNEYIECNRMICVSLHLTFKFFLYLFSFKRCLPRRRWRWMGPSFPTPLLLWISGRSGDVVTSDSSFCPICIVTIQLVYLQHGITRCTVHPSQPKSWNLSYRYITILCAWVKAIPDVSRENVLRTHLQYPIKVELSPSRSQHPLSLASPTVRLRSGSPDCCMDNLHGALGGGALLCPRVFALVSHV